jgi:hypothetical protein
MTDEELLLQAAKVAGRGHTVGRDWHDKGAVYVDGQLWNPLADDGDAMRLAARLELDVLHRVVGGKRVEVLAAGGPLIQEFYEGEPYSATRRAIVRSAAEVARKRATKET